MHKRFENFSSQMVLVCLMNTGIFARLEIFVWFVLFIINPPETFYDELYWSIQWIITDHMEVANHNNISESLQELITVYITRLRLFVKVLKFSHKLISTSNFRSHCIFMVKMYDVWNDVWNPCYLTIKPISYIIFYVTCVL